MTGFHENKINTKFSITKYINNYFSSCVLFEEISLLPHEAMNWMLPPISGHTVEDSIVIYGHYPVFHNKNRHDNGTYPCKLHYVKISDIMY